MNVLYEMPFAGLGGTEKHVLTLIQALGRRVGACVIAPEGEAHAMFRGAGVPCHVVPRLVVGPGMRSSLRAYRETVARLVDSHDIRLIHAHAGVELVLATRPTLPAIPIVFTAHGYPDLLSYLASARVANRMVDEVISVSRSEAKLLAGRGFRPDKMTIIHNGVYPSRPTGAGLRFRRERGIPETVTVIGTVSRLERSKGLRYLLAAFARVHRDCPDTLLVIVGGGSLDSDLRVLVKRLGVGDSTLFAGPSGEPPAIVEAMDIFAIASIREALCIAVLEAMSLARPVVATSVGGLPELVIDGQTGLLVPPRDSEGLARALLALARDPSKQSEYGARGRERVEREFTADLMASRTLEVYRRALARTTA